MNIERFAWIPPDGLSDCPEKRFVLAFIIQTIQDAQSYSNAPDSHKIRPSYIESIQIHRQWLAEPRFSWYCELMGLPSLKVAANIVDVLAGKRKVNPRVLRVGRTWEDYEACGFAAAPSKSAKCNKLRWAKDKQHDQGNNTPRNSGKISKRNGRLSPRSA